MSARFRHNRPPPVFTAPIRCVAPRTVLRVVVGVACKASDVTWCYPGLRGVTGAHKNCKTNPPRSRELPELARRQRVGVAAASRNVRALIGPAAWRR